MFDLLIPPSRCTGSLPTDLDAENLVAELKMDGSRYVLYLGYDPYKRREGNTLLSRRLSTVDNKHVDRTDNVPHITALEYGDLAGTVLDGEIFLFDFRTTQGIMGSGPALAQQKQEGMKVKYWVFDCPVYRGKDIRGLPLEKRRKVLEDVVRRMNNEYVVAMPQWKTDFEKIFTKVVERGGEGLIIKNLGCGYGVSWAKMKKSYETSCFISGFKSGKGKYSDAVGSIAISVYIDGKEKEVGFASGFDDKIRADITRNPKKYLGKVVDIYAQEISKDDRLRHPTFFRFREDLNAKDCTMEKLKSDLKKSVKSKRFRYED